MKSRFLILALVASLVISGAALAQSGTTGKVSGNVTAEGVGIPGVTVTLTSAKLQGERVSVTRDNGSYVFPSLPAGTYEVVFELDGYAPVNQEAKVSVAQLTVLDVDLNLTVAEEIVVTGEISTISQSVAAQSTYEQALIEKLPTGRTVRDVTLLAPGVQESGVARGGERGLAISIAGSQTYENLFMVNGVTINENTRGQALDLYIEDAVEETTASVSGVSAEYGRFSGGVINVITKSGGNDFSGSFRVNFTNDDWESPTAQTTAQSDEINRTFEATLGGRLIRDKLWFFAAGRDVEQSTTNNLQLTNFPVQVDNTQERQELKLTVTPHPSHSLVGSYLNRDQVQTNDEFNGVDASTLTDREDPQELGSGNYTGIFGSNFFVEAQYSEREFTIGKGGGAKTTERLGGTWIVDLTQFAFIGSPVFCGVCVDQMRNNEGGFLKGNYFLATENAGSHDLVFGYDTFSDIVIVENHQSGSDFSVWAFQPFIIRGTEVFPQFTSNGPNRLQWNPVFNPTRGSEFESNAFYVNDRWALNDKWSFNLGLRYDENDAIDSGGGTVSDDDNISPRFGATYDLKGDGDWVFAASYGQYVQPIHNGGNTGGAGASAGALSDFRWQYTGPAINPDPNAPTDQLLNADQALQVIFDWFAGIGDTNNTTNLIFQSIPGVGTRVNGSLNSPNVQELSLGFTKQLGSRGLFRADYVNREFADFYVNRVDSASGQVANPDGSLSDLTLVENNDDLLERKYDGLHTQFAFRLTDKLNIAGNWTWSHARGNWNGETRDQGPVSSAILSYPELKQFDRHEPFGDLDVDVRHKVRLWAVWEAFNSDHHSLSLSLLQAFSSGRPYGASGVVNSRPFVAGFDDIGYLFPPPTVTYWFTGRDEFTSDDITRTDFSVNYSFLWNLFGKQFEVYVQPELLNIFDEDGVQTVNTTVVDAASGGACPNTPDGNCATFNPFTDTPVEGVHWARGANFGQATQENDFQQPRTVRFSVGFRF